MMKRAQSSVLLVLLASVGFGQDLPPRGGPSGIFPANVIWYRYPADYGLPETTIFPTTDSGDLSTTAVNAPQTLRAAIISGSWSKLRRTGIDSALSTDIRHTFGLDSTLPMPEGPGLTTTTVQTPQTLENAIVPGTWLRVPGVGINSTLPMPEAPGLTTTTVQTPQTLQNAIVAGTWLRVPGVGINSTLPMPEAPGLTTTTVQTPQTLQNAIVAGTWLRVPGVGINSTLPMPEPPGLTTTTVQTPQTLETAIIPGVWLQTNSGSDTTKTIGLPSSEFVSPLAFPGTNTESIGNTSVTAAPVNSSPFGGKGAGLGGGAPVPEPASIAGLTLGLIALAKRARKR